MLHFYLLIFNISEFARDTVWATGNKMFVLRIADGDNRRRLNFSTFVRVSLVRCGIKI